MDEIEVPNSSWTLSQVLHWAKTSLNYLEKDLEILEKNEITGAKLISMTKTQILELGLVVGTSIKLRAMTNIAKYSHYHKEVVEYQKRLISHVNEFYKLNVLFPSEPDSIKSAKIWKVWDVHHKTKEEKIASMLTLKDRLQDSPNENVVSVSLKMPLVEYEKAKAKVMSMFETNLSGHRSGEKFLHRLCFIAGGKGSGKSRMCHEVKGWCEEFVKTHPKIESLVPIYVDISNCKNTSLFKEFNNVTKIIGPRMVCSAFSKSASDFQKEVENHPDILKISYLETAVATIRCDKPTGLCAILLVIDEFNCIGDNTEWYQGVLRTIGQYMTSGWAVVDNVVIFPVIAGTIFYEFSRLFYHTSYNATMIDLEPLSKQSISHVFQTCLPTHAAWLNFKPFQQFLHLMASTPSVLQELIEMIETQPGTDLPTLEYLQELGTSLKRQLVKKKGPDTRDYHYMAGFDNLLHFILAGTHTNHSLHYPFLKNLQIEGLVYRQGHWPQYVYMPYHLFLRANETYGRYPKRIEQSVVPRELLPIPGLPYTWDTFKKLDHVLDAIRIKSQQFSSEDGTSPLYSIFQADMDPETQHKMKVVLPRDVCCVTEIAPFIQGDEPVENNKMIKTSRGTVVENFYTDYAFLCTDSLMVDGRIFFTTPKNKKIMVVKYYYMGHSKENANSSTIEFEQVKAWHERLKKSLVKFAEDYRILYFFITNKTIKSFHKSFIPENLMLVHSENFVFYYGPFIAQFAELIDSEDDDKMEIDTN